MGYLVRAPIKYAPALVTNIRLSCKVLREKNTLAYLSGASETEKIDFTGLPPS
jgi:hypothetical protein